MKNANRRYKDSLFTMLFSDRDNLLSLYNAVNHSSYDNADILQINTIENAVFLGVHNDVSFVICSSLNLYEHQSTVNPNIPLRMLFYVTRLFSAEVPEERLFSKKRIKIPRPKFLIFYNGTEKQPECREYRLSELWDPGDEVPDLELNVIQLNINPGMNKELKAACRVLSEYMTFVEHVRAEYKESDSLEESIKRTIRWCIDQNVLKDFLSKHQTEVMELLLDNYDEEKVRQVLMEDAREEGHSEGLAEGHAEGRTEGFAEGLRYLIGIIAGKISSGCSLEQIHKDLGTDKAEIDALYDVITYAGEQADEKEILEGFLQRIKAYTE